MKKNATKKHKIPCLLLVAFSSLLCFSCKDKDKNNDIIKIATTTSDFSGFDGYETDKSKIKAIHDAGFKYIDLSLYSLNNEHEYMQENWKEKIFELKSFADELGIEFVQAHSQGGNANSDNQEEVDFIINSTIRSIEICGLLGIKNTVVHAGTNIKYSKEEWLEANKAFYDKLLPTAEKYNVNILCENTTSKNIGSAYGLTDADKILELVNYINHPNFHVCWDFGHGNCEPNHAENIKKLGSEIYAIHIHDNFGDQDAHLLPFFGNLDFKSILSALKEINFSGFYTFECDANIRTSALYSGKDFRENLGLKSSFDLQSLNRIQEEQWLYLSAKDLCESFLL